MPNRLARALRCLSLLVPSLYADDDCSVAAPEAAAVENIHEYHGGVKWGSYAVLYTKLLFAN